MKIYWAGPLFTLAERQWNVEATNLLAELGHDIWLPQQKEPREKSAKSIFEMDRDGIDWAEVVVAVMDGSDPDSGTAWECGYAHGTKKKVVTIRTDFRNNGDIDNAKFNLMLAASADEAVYAPFVNTVDVIISIQEKLLGLF